MPVKADMHALRPPCLMTTPTRNSRINGGRISKRAWSELRGKHDDSKLAKRLRTDVVWGHVSATQAQQIAADAIYDGARPTKLLKKLSKLGCEGKYPYGCWRDFSNMMNCSFVEETLLDVQIPLKSGGYGTLRIVPPHAMFSALYHADKKKLASIMFGSDPANIKLFWDSQQDHPQYRDHCMHDHPYCDFKTAAIPFGLHGDEVASVGCGKAWAKLSHCVSWTSLLANGNLEEIMQVIFQIYSCLCKGTYGNDTLDEIFRVVVWSFNALYAGVWPSKDHYGRPYKSGPSFQKAGTPLADGYCAIWWATQVDLDYMCKTWKAARYNANEAPCNSCSCNSTTKPWGDCRPKAAGWLKHLWTRVSYARSHPNRHILFRDVPSGGILTYIPDVLHVKHLGTDPFFYAGAIHILTHYTMSGSPQDNLDLFFQKVSIQYKINRIQCRYAKLSPTMIKQAKKKDTTAKRKGWQN